MRKSTMTVGLILLLSLSAAADVVVLKEGSLLASCNLLNPVFAGVTAANIINVTIDDTAFHDNWAANAGYGAAVSWDSSLDDKLIKFDLASLPGFIGGTVNMAQLVFHQTAGNAGGATALILTHDWNEATAGRYSPTGSTTLGWGAASNAKFSAAGDGAALTAMTVGSFYTGPYSIYEAWLVGTVTADAQAIADGQANYGWYFQTSNRTILTSEHSGDGYRPALYLDYTPVPEPATLAVLGLGVLFGSRRRRG